VAGLPLSWAGYSASERWTARSLLCGFDRAVTEHPSSRDWSSYAADVSRRNPASPGTPEIHPAPARAT
jgi:hypothetical protein